MNTIRKPRRRGTGAPQRAIVAFVAVETGTRGPSRLPRNARHAPTAAGGGEP